jgi:hypothetical protein
VCVREKERERELRERQRVCVHDQHSLSPTHTYGPVEGEREEREREDTREPYLMFPGIR